MEYFTKNNQNLYKYGNIFHNMQLDDKDLKILEILKQKSNSRTSQISKKTKIPITTIHNRIKKLEKEKIIKNYTINIDFTKIEKPLKAYILISVNQGLLSQEKLSQKDVGEKIKELEETESVDIVTGTTDMIVLTRVATINKLNEFLTKKLRNILGINQTQTMVVLKEI
jgi:DNA-binding Lrp family transcriptional regulator